MVTNDTLEEGRQVPAPLNLPFGKLFFGFTVVPYKAPEAAQGKENEPAQVRTPAYFLIISSTLANLNGYDF